MIEIPVHNQAGEQVGKLEVDEQLLGGEVRPVLLKQAYVRFHANRRIGAAKTRTRSELVHSTRKLYRQKGTGQARRGDRNANLLVGGYHAHPKKPHSWRKDMPEKMRRLANRNALLAKAVDGEIKIIDSLGFDKPSTKQFNELLNNLGIDRSCLLALDDVNTGAALSARNVDRVSLTQIDRLNAFDLLNHRYLLADREALEGYLGQRQGSSGVPQAGGHPMNFNDVIKQPLITEKSTWESERHNRYAFEVDLRADKGQIRQAIESLYNVRVDSVRTQIRKGKYFRTRFGPAKTSEWKKATVQLHGEDRIDLF